MNNIFFRIYSGMLISLILVGFLFYLAISSVNHYRSEQYYNFMVRGTVSLIASGIERHEGYERERWQVLLNRVLGVQVSVLDQAELTIQSSDIKHLNEGQLVVVVDHQVDSAEIYSRLKGETKYLQVQMSSFSEQLIRGSAYLFLEELKNFPQSQQAEQAEKLGEQFGYPVHVEDWMNVGLDPAQRARLQKGEVIVSFADGPKKQDSAIHAIAPMTERGRVVIFGPIKLFNPYPSELLVVAGLIGLFAIWVAGYVLVRPLHQRLKRMENAVVQLRRGDLTARVEVTSGDSLGQLGKTLNDMAIHIQRLIQSQREMTNAVSHELRTPVARIRFGLEMIQDAIDDEQRAKQIKGIDADIEELDTLIDEILTYATLEEGTPALNWVMVDIVQIIAQIQKETSQLGTHIAVEREIKDLEGDNRLVECEERYIHRVIQNLVVNAIRYAERIVKVTACLEGGMMRIEVEDDGPGIPQDQWEKVFVPFARLDDSRTRKSGGYGLGLSIVQRIVYWHGGVASVNRSAKLGGARFTIIWPRTQEIRYKMEEEQVKKSRKVA